MRIELLPVVAKLARRLEKRLAAMDADFGQAIGLDARMMRWVRACDAKHVYINPDPHGRWTRIPDWRYFKRPADSATIQASLARYERELIKLAYPAMKEAA